MQSLQTERTEETQAAVDLIEKYSMDGWDLEDAGFFQLARLLAGENGVEFQLLLDLLA